MRSTPLQLWLVALTYSPLALCSFPHADGQFQTPQTIHAFANVTSVETIIATPDRKVLATSIGPAQLHSIDLNTNQSKILHHFAGHDGVFGMAQGQDSTYYVFAGNWSGPPNFVFTPDTWSLYSVRLGNGAAQAVHKVLDLNGVQAQDGSVFLDDKKTLLAFGDPQAGKIWLMNLTTKQLSVLADDALLAPATNPYTQSNTNIEHEGTNGLQVHGERLYFTNSAKKVFGSLPIDECTGKALGSPQVISTSDTYLDDFAIDRAGNVFLTELFKGIWYIPRGTTHKDYASGGYLAKLATVNALAFGTATGDEASLYAVGSNSATINLLRLDLQRDSWHAHRDRLIWLR